MITDNTCIKIEYDAYIKEANALFDTTSEKKAKEAGVYYEKANYGPVNVLVGRNFVVQGLDDSFKGKKEGDKYSIDVPPEKAFGKKDGKLMRLIPTKYFTKNEIRPMPGLQVFIDNVPGIIRTASPGRVIVDFNHPLAGKNLKYDVKILEILNEDSDIVKAIIEFFLGKEDVIISMEKGDVKVKTKEEVAPQIKKLIEKMAKETLKKEYTFTFTL